MKATKILCTLGPSCNSEQDVLRLAEMGMNVARINMSHGDWAQHQGTIRMLKRINAKLAKRGGAPYPIAILMDTKGAEVRTSVVERPIEIAEGQEVVFHSKAIPGEKRPMVIVNYDKFGKDVRQAESIILDNGKIIFELVDIRRDGSVVAKAGESGTIGSRRHVNLPGANLSLPSITEKDWEDIRHSIEEDVDFFALSFVREAAEIEEVRAFITKHGKQAGLIAKIETRQSVTNMREIVEASDGIMVARGDLGSEVDFATIPVIQDQLVALSRHLCKPVIVATHMLESMIENPTPTRAEVTDIAHAVTIGTDATMLSGETASGKFPHKSLDAMVRVLTATEGHLATLRNMEQAPIHTSREAQAQAAVSLAITTEADAIVVMTKNGHTARDISRFRPTLPIFAFTPSDAVQRSMQLLYGVQPMVVPFGKNPEATVTKAFDMAKKAKCLASGQSVVLVSDTKAGTLSVSSVQMRMIP